MLKILDLFFNSNKRLLKQLNNGSKRVGNLNPERENHVEVVFQYLQSKPSVIKTLHTEVENVFIKKCVEKDYKLFLHLTPEQYDEEMANNFLYTVLAKSYKQNVKAKDNEQFIGRSYDESLVLNVLYQTHDGEQIYYYDNQLEVPTFLIANIQFSFKVNSAISLFRKLDTSLTMIGYNKVVNELTRWVNVAYRQAIHTFISNEKLDVYKLTGLYGEIENELYNELNKILEGSGLSVYRINVNKINIPENTYKLLEKQSLELVNEKNRRNNELEYEKMSLENYALKAEIHSRNPGFELTLTEAEKDFALNRYITKHDVDTNKVRKEIESSTNELADRKVKVADTKIEKVADVIGTVKKKVNVNLILYVVAALFALIGITLIAQDEPGSGLILLGLGVLAGGSSYTLSSYKKHVNGSKGGK